MFLLQGSRGQKQQNPQRFIKLSSGKKDLFFNLGETEVGTAFELMQQLREKEIPCELYHESSKFDKQFKYAEKKNIPFIIIIGSKELEEKQALVKDLRSGDQQPVSFEKLAFYEFL